MEEEKKINIHEDNEKSEAEAKREDAAPGNTDNTIKKDGITSAFSAGTKALIEQNKINETDAVVNNDEE